jgi:hypothetical protein
LGAEIDVGQAEALGVAFGPFEIVEQAPAMVAADIRAVFHGTGHGAEVAAQEGDAALVGNAAVLVRAALIRSAGMSIEEFLTLL